MKNLLAFEDYALKWIPKSDLQCPVCYENYDNDTDNKPKQIGCGHHLCKKCLKYIVETEEFGSRCPICKIHLNLTNQCQVLGPRHSLIRQIVNWESVDENWVIAQAENIANEALDEYLIKNHSPQKPEIAEIACQTEEIEKPKVVSDTCQTDPVSVQEAQISCLIEEGVERMKEEEFIVQPRFIESEIQPSPSRISELQQSPSRISEIVSDKPVSESEELKSDAGWTDVSDDVAWRFRGVRKRLRKIERTHQVGYKRLGKKRICKTVITKTFYSYDDEE